MKITQLLAGVSVPTLSGLLKTLIEFFIDREEAASDDVRAVGRAVIDRGGILPKWIDLIEIVYARSDETGPVMKQLAAAAASALEAGNYSGRAEHWALVSQILKRRAGVKPPVALFWPLEKDDPAPESKWALPHEFNQGE